MNALSYLSGHGLSDEGLAVLNPATLEVVGTAHAYSAADMTQIVERAEAAMVEWSKRPAKERGAILRRWFDLIVRDQMDLAKITTAESGKPLAEAAGEALYAASFVEWYAEEGKRAYGQVIPPNASGNRIMTFREPVGVTAAITPWNFPLAMITRKVAPALAAGCPMIVKPAEATPLSALALEKLALEAGLPEFLFKVTPTSDPANVGKALCEHPTIRKLSFTGSTRVGKILLEQCAGTVKRTSMELGGNAPFIVYDDADLDAALDGVQQSKFRNAGQTCICANRIFVQRGVYEEYLEMLAARTRELVVGDGADEGVQIGPLITPDAVDKVEELVASSIAAGAEALVGGARLDRAGNFFEPTVLAKVTPDMPISRNEIFGPVAPVIPFDDEKEALTLANDTPYGLAAYAYTRDVGRIFRTIEGLDYGMVGVNGTALGSENTPFGGVKESGLGREGSHHGLDEYLEIKYANIGGI